MATMECSNSQSNNFASAPAENGDALPEEKALSIDYSEDLWLASEESSAPYSSSSKAVSQQQQPQQPSAPAMDVQNSSTISEEGSSSIPSTSDSSHHHLSTDTPEKSSWNESTSEETSGRPEVGVANLQPAQLTYVNGETPAVSEHNGMDYSSGGGGGGEQKDFAQLMPAGSYLESGGGVVSNQEVGQDKTFTSLMPAAGLGANGEIQQASPQPQQQHQQQQAQQQPQQQGATYTTMLAPGHPPPMVFYGSGDQLPSEQDALVASNHGNAQQSPAGQAALAYNHSAEPGTTYELAPATNGDHAHHHLVKADPTGNGTEEAAAGQSSVVSSEGNFAMLNPALMGSITTSASAGEAAGGVYTAQIAASGTQAVAAAYHNISTLPFVQNGSASFAQGQDPSGNPAGVPSPLVEGQQVQQVQPGVEYEAENPAFAGDGSGGSVGDDDEDEEDMEESGDLPVSGEVSEFMCHICSEPFSDQTALDEHVENHPPVKTFVCDTCGKGFATRRYLKYHRKNHCKRAGSYEGRADDEADQAGGEKRFVCNVCSRPFRVLKCMRVHKKKKHGILKDFTCGECAVTFNAAEDLMSHPCQPIEAPAVAAAPPTPQPAPLPEVQVQDIKVEQLQPQPQQQQQQQQQQQPAMTQFQTPGTPVVIPILQARASAATPTFPAPMSSKKKKKRRQAKPACDICGKLFADRISVDIHRVKHIEEELYPCDMCDQCVDEDPENRHLAVYFRIKFFTDDNQHILEDQKAAVAGGSETPVKMEVDHPGSGPQTPTASSTPLSAPATPVYLTRVNHQGLVDPQQQQQQQAVAEYVAAGDQQQQQQHPEQAQTPSGNYIVNQYVVADESQVLDPQQANILLNQQQQQQQQAPGQALYTSASPAADGSSGTQESDQERLVKMRRMKHHMCDICNKSFADSAKLELHYKSNHLEDRPFQCDVCDKSFFTKWKLQRHMLSHLEQKPHSCPMCSKSFVERGKLEAHYRTHLGTKPFKCEHCQKAFTVKSQLTIHVRRIHSTDQPFACLECGKAFLWKSGLEKHMRKHTREKPYHCSRCDQKYSNKANLIVHMSKVHNEEYVEVPTSQ